MLKEKQTNCKSVANKESKKTAKYPEIYQNVHCPKFNLKKIRDML